MPNSSLTQSVSADSQVGAPFHHAVARGFSGRLDEMNVRVQAASGLEPDCAEAQNNLGNHFYFKGEYDNAVRCYERALFLNPGFAQAYSNLGNTLSALGRHEEAAVRCRQALRLRPDYVQAYNNLGNALEGLGKLEEAVGCYRQALQLNPDFAEVGSNLAMALAGLNSTRPLSAEIATGKVGPAVSPTGFWLGHGPLHYHDAPLCLALCDLFAGASVLDLGCGDGWYVDNFLNAGIAAFGVDGNPDTRSWPNATHGQLLVADLSVSLNLPPHDWVLSLEVGEHLPPEYADTFLDNVVRHARRGVVLSWAVPGQGGHGHFNERDNLWVRRQMAARGFEHDADLTQSLRGSSTLPWFAGTLMCFGPVRRGGE